MKIAALVLAAGRSERMGQPKMLLPWHGRTIVETIVEGILAGDFCFIQVVVGFRGEEVKRVLATISDERLRCVENPDFALGMLSSIQAGLRSLPGPVEGMMIALGDQPGIPAETYQKLRERFAQSKEIILIPSYHGKRGHPIFLRDRTFAELLELDPARDSLHAVTAHYAEQTCTLPWEEMAVVQDLDTPEDYQRLLARGK